MNFEKLYKENYTDFYFTAMKFAKNRFDAEDLLQDTSYKAFKFFHLYKPISNFSSWFYQIMKNQYINEYRKRSKAPSIRQIFPQDAIYENNYWNNINQSNNHTDLFEDEILIAIKKIPNVYRLPLLYFCIDQLSYKEIADYMAIPLGTVMSRIYRGKKLLRYKLKLL